ncbi:unnamed protein product [Schistosoma mattheei]|uniref:Uncharacterized protein n=1 Tax=Schistosoma mattheei TaxID=31246 RepID=A0A183NQK0_9TREM|nr:unnamed protein product [Schistosoma mattheei]
MHLRLRSFLARLLHHQRIVTLGTTILGSSFTFSMKSKDDLPPRLFKDGGDFLVKEMTTLLTKVWELESVPTSWIELIVLPIFKKGPYRFRNNY